MGQKWTCGVFAWPCLAVEKPIVRCRGVMDGEKSRGCGRVTAAVSGLAACLAACCPTAGPKLANPCKWLAGRDGVRCGLQWLRPVDTVDGREPSLHGTNLKQGSHQDTVSFIRVTVTALKVSQYLCEFSIPSHARPNHHGISNAIQTPVPDQGHACSQVPVPSLMPMN